jgi:hypothetical protein
MNISLLSDKACTGGRCRLQWHDWHLIPCHSKMHTVRPKMSRQLYAFVRKALLACGWWSSTSVQPQHIRYQHSRSQKPINHLPLTTAMADTTSTAPHPYISENGSFHAGLWDYDHKRPIVDGKFEHPVTGLVTTASKGSYSYLGPPNVDIVVMNLHEKADCYRAARPFPVERVLWHVMKVIKEMGLQFHSVNATPYSVTIVLASDLEGKKYHEDEGFLAVASRISNGLWNEPWDVVEAHQDKVRSDLVDE